MWAVKQSSPNLVLLVEAAKSDGGLPYWAARWHEGDQYPKLRLGKAWLAPTGSRAGKPGGKTYGQRGQWTQRSGRVPDGVLDEAAALVLAATAREERAGRIADEREARRREAMTFRALAREWQAFKLKNGKHKPSTARDVQSTLAERGISYKRGSGETQGLVMRTLGDLPAHEITHADVEGLLDEYEELGRSNRTINKIREQLRGIFNYGRDPRYGWDLQTNPAALTERREVDQVAGIRFFEVEEVEAIAKAAASGDWRGDALAAYARNPAAEEQEQEENEQLAELIRFAAYTGLRQAELVVLEWGDINNDQTVTVQRALSGSAITSPKSGKLRVVPLGDPAVHALKRLKQRPNFTARHDYVFATLAGDRPDPSALRRRYNKARDAAGAHKLTFHGLRHTAASLFIRKLDIAEVQTIMGHASSKTTEQYLHARRASDLVAKVNDALTARPLSEEERLAGQLLALDAGARQRLLAHIGTAAV